jgi:hypothetical protein
VEDVIGDKGRVIVILLIAVTGIGMLGRRR